MFNLNLFGFLLVWYKIKLFNFPSSVYSVIVVRNAVSVCGHLVLSRHVGLWIDVTCSHSRVNVTPIFTCYVLQFRRDNITESGQ